MDAIVAWPIWMKVFVMGIGGFVILIVIVVFWRWLFGADTEIEEESTKNNDGEGSRGTFTIEVQKREKDEKFGFGDLEMFHQECQGGKIIQESTNYASWNCECTRCGQDISLGIHNNDTVRLINTAIDGEERKILDTWYENWSDFRVSVVQRR